MILGLRTGALLGAALLGGVACGADFDDFPYGHDDDKPGHPKDPKGGAGGTGNAGSGGTSTGGTGTGGSDMGGSGGDGTGGVGTGGSGMGGMGGMGTGGGGMAGMGGMPEPGELRFSAQYIHPECYTREVEFEVFDVRAEDGNPVPVDDYECEWAFDDGVTLDVCNGRHTFAESGSHEALVTVRQLSTGALGTFTANGFVFEPHVVTVTATAPECGLSIVWDSTVSTASERHSFIEPSDKVLTPSNEIVTVGSGIASVSEPGVYTVEVLAIDERPIPICETTGSTTVTVKACDGPPPKPGPMAVIVGGIFDEFCDASVRLETWAYDARGNEIQDIACQWLFEDGTSSKRCDAVIPFTASDSVVSAELVVIDLRDNSQLTKVVTGFVENPLETPTVQLVPPACGLFADFTFGDTPIGVEHVVEVTNGTESFEIPYQSTGRVGFPAAGTWQVRHRITSFEDGCTAEGVASVGVVACGCGCPMHAAAIPAGHDH